MSQMPDMEPPDSCSLLCLYTIMHFVLVVFLRREMGDGLQGVARLLTCAGAGVEVMTK